MGKVFEAIDPKIENWISRQQMFFVATAPSGDEGLINCSPKGLDTLRVLGPHDIAYLDLGGSGVETIAHLKQNGRMVLMMCAFEGPPKIIRFYGTGTAVEPGDDGFEELLAHFPDFAMPRAVIRLSITRIADSCGYGVPRYQHEGKRDAMENWVASKTEQEMLDYRKQNNSTSLDGLPGIKT